MRYHSSAHSIRSAGLAAIALAGITLVCSAGFHLTNATIVALSYLLVVLLAAAYSSLWVAIAASVAAVLLLNYFFLPPVGTWTIAEPHNLVALFVLLAVSVVASNLSSSAQIRAREATARRDELGRLFDLSRDILLTTQSEDAHQDLARSIARRFDLRYVAICLPGPPAWRILEAGGGFTLPHDQLESVMQSAAGTLEVERRQAGYVGRQTIHSREGLAVDLVPLRVAGRPVGLLAIAGQSVEKSTLEALAGIAAIAVERVQFLEERKAADVGRRSAELKSALLASLAHDLRTPLTAIRVAAGNLQSAWATDADRQVQSEIVLGEVERLNRLFESILDMARIEALGVTASPEWVTPGEIVEAAVTQVQPALGGHDVRTDATDRVVVHLDPRLTSSALAHLLENAAQYSPAGTTVRVAASASDDRLEIVVEDEGPGIAEADMPRLFERFFRGRASAGRPAGAGMGLAISRGLLAAQQGSIRVENKAGGGARFVISVPAAVRPLAAEPE